MELLFNGAEQQREHLYLKRRLVRQGVLSAAGKAAVERAVRGDPLRDPVPAGDGISDRLCDSGRRQSKLVGILADPYCAAPSRTDGHGTGHHHLQHDHEVPRSVGTGRFWNVTLDVRDSGCLSAFDTRGWLDEDDPAHQSRDHAARSVPLRGAGKRDDPAAVFGYIMDIYDRCCAVWYCDIQQGRTQLYGYGLIIAWRIINMTIENNRKNGLDILKCFCIPFIILLHTGALKNSFPINIEPICRFAVPCFFMITGFFYNSVVKRGKELKQIKKVIILILVANAVLFILNIIYIHNISDILNWLRSCISKESINNLLVFNEGIIKGHFGSSHVWYLNALLYILIIAYAFRNLNIFKILYYLTPILLIMGFIVECFSKQLFGVSFIENDRYYIYRNFLTVGIPYFCIGNLLNKVNIDALKPKRYILMVVSLILIGISYIEFRIELHFGLSTNGEFFIATPFCAVCIFLFFCCFFETEKLSRISKFFALIGRKYVVWIYIFHLPIIVLIDDALLCFGISSPNKIMLSMLTLVFSLVVAVAVDFTINVFKVKRG